MKTPRKCDIIGLFPAHAGVIPWLPLLSTMGFPFPRPRGGDP